MVPLLATEIVDVRKNKAVVTIPLLHQQTTISVFSMFSDKK